MATPGKEGRLRAIATAKLIIMGLHNVTIQSFLGIEWRQLLCVASTDAGDDRRAALSRCAISLSDAHFGLTVTIMNQASSYHQTSHTQRVGVVITTTYDG